MRLRWVRAGLVGCGSHAPLEVPGAWRNHLEHSFFPGRSAIGDGQQRSDGLPDADDSVLIPAGVPGVVYSSQSHTVASVVSQSPLTIAGGTLEVLNTLEVASASDDAVKLNLAGGTLIGATVTNDTSTVVTSTSTLDNVTLNGDLDLTQINGVSVNVFNGLTLNGRADLGNPNGSTYGRGGKGDATTRLLDSSHTQSFCFAAVGTKGAHQELGSFPRSRSTLFARDHFIH